MESEYKLKFKDYLEANFYYSKRTNLIVFSIIVIFFVIEIITLGEFDLLLAINNIFPIIGLFILFIFFQVFNIVALWKKQSILHRPIVISFNSEQIKLHNESFNSTLKWSSYYRYQETKNLFLIYLSSRSFYLIPKRAFASTQVINELRQLLKGKIGKTPVNLEEELPSLDSYPCHFSYRLNFQDYLKVRKATLRSQRFRWMLSWIFSLLFIFLGGFLLLLALLSTIFFLLGSPDTNADGEEVFTLYAVAILWFLSIYLFISGLLLNPRLGLLTKWQTSRMWKTTPSLREPVNIGVNEEQITIHSPSFESFITWEDYQKYLETEDYFIIYILYPQLFNIYPKRAFENSQSVEIFRQFLASKVDTNSDNYN